MHSQDQQPKSVIVFGIAKHGQWNIIVSRREASVQ